MARTLYEKIWDRHVVRAETSETPAVLYIDLHLIHEVTSPQAFDRLRERGLKVARPERVLATMDHSTPTSPPNDNGNYAIVDSEAAHQIQRLRENCREFDIDLHELGSSGQGIVHVIGPEQGRTWPGSTIVCGDSHTATHGAFGALAFGIGTTEVGHVLATQCLLQRRTKTMAVNVTGTLPPGSSAKDLALAVIARIGVGGGTGYVIEYRGACIEALSMEERMTLCNMSIEAGARSGLIAPDEITFNYLKGKPGAPRDWAKAMADWSNLSSDSGAVFDREITLDASQVHPRITFGCDPSQSVQIGERIPEVDKAILDYQGLYAGQRIDDVPVDVVFVGSCTNSRLSDLRAAAEVLHGQKVAARVRMLVVPGSQQIKADAEKEGLDRVFLDAGAEWREPGCSMCIAMNGDRLEPGQVAVSTSNRNFRGRQGPGGRTFLASPATAAASAVTGKVTDARRLQHETV